MNAARFFVENFARHFIQPSGDDWRDVGEMLRRSYPVAGKGVSRLQSGWAIVREGSSTVQLDVAVPGLLKSRATRNEAFATELAEWDGKSPRIFLLFDKAPVPAEHVFLSVDKRHVRICTNKGALIEDWTVNPPTPKGSKR